MSSSSDLLIKVRGSGKALAKGLKGMTGITVEPLLTVPASKAGAQDMAGDSATWWKIGLAGGQENPWDAAHALIEQARTKGFAGVSGKDIEAIEPDFEQQWIHQNQDDPIPGKPFAAASEKDRCAFDDQDKKHGKACGTSLAWNLGDAFSQLILARKAVSANEQKAILIAHLDTGYDPKHCTLPANLRLDLQRSFVKADKNPNSAQDQVPAGLNLFRNRGHGTATLALLAGNKVNSPLGGWDQFNDYLGGAPFASVMPVRVADWVVRFSTSTIVKGINYARENKAHVLSMSMGGLASHALADAVNLAYEAGLVLVTAAGNNMAKLSPSTTVFPARFKRVLSACGLMADGRAYTGLRIGTMQGNFGPASKMETAIGAFTPNVPWAKIDCLGTVDMDGAGTSAATPQVAAAAALWLAKNRAAWEKYSEPWMRVEAVRHALFVSALKVTASMDADQTHRTIGQGVMQAMAALAVAAPAGHSLQQASRASTTFPFLNLIFGKGGVTFAGGARIDPQQEAMLRLELTQMAQRERVIDEVIADPDIEPGDSQKNAPSPAVINRYFELALERGHPSKKLRAFLEQQLGRKSPAIPRPTPVPAGKPSQPFSASPGDTALVQRTTRKPPLPKRRLRVFALDPSLAKNLDSFGINEAVLSVPWDDSGGGGQLKPGPVGEYLEIVDIDPASNRIYAPVDLNEKTLLAQDGWAPSEGNPQFHQQMVYAVAMTTIGHFERALGRRALWAPKRGSYNAEGRGQADQEVRRLRIYPHALRTANAYYSPDKKALLFGYFQAQSTFTDSTSTGSTVFTCLSSDIIAHETTHALLDGLHRRFQESSNPDVPAFHEAFADIVALFQHFTMKEVVRHEIRHARGDLSAANLLAGLARQFGEGSGRKGPLRNYRDTAIGDLPYETTLDAHHRGSLLVFAVYRAFLKAVAYRTTPTIRLATGGSGVLAPGALHPDLVDRLTEETCAVAADILQICIRALDYCPAVDITFGEYLRALITSDRDLSPEDNHRYRIAFQEAFREQGILPRDVRTVSEDTLAWGSWPIVRPSWLKDVLANIKLHWDQDLDRSEIFNLNNKNRWAFFRSLKKAFIADPSLYAQFGLVADLPRYDPRGKAMTPLPPKGQSTFEVFSVRPARRIAPDGSFRTELVVVIQQRRPEPLDGQDLKNGFFWFRGGATLIIDPRPGHEEIRYSIIKNTGSANRLQRQREYMQGIASGTSRALYFGMEDRGEPFAMLHANDGDVPHG